MTPGGPFWAAGVVVANIPLSPGMRRLDLELPRPVLFEPGQFAMLNRTGREERVFGRPFSILDAEGRRLSFLYRVVGGGTAALAAVGPGTPLTCLAPLGRPFAPPSAPACLLLAGGVGLPPLWAWWRRHARPADLACFGARDVADVPWPLLDLAWRVSVEQPGAAPGDERGGAPAGSPVCLPACPPAGREVFTGNVVELAASLLAGREAPMHVLACGPRPMLRAAVRLAGERGWPCYVSVEEHMGCGYGVCRGCVVPAAGGGHCTACQDGPVLPAAAIDWERFGRPPADCGPADGGPGGGGPTAGGPGHMEARP